MIKHSNNVATRATGNATCRHSAHILPSFDVFSAENSANIPVSVCISKKKLESLILQEHLYSLSESQAKESTQTDTGNRFLEPRGSNFTPLKSTFNAEHFICIWSISNGFGAIHFLNVYRSLKSSQKNH